MSEFGPLTFVFFCLVITLSYAVRGSAGFGGVTVPLLALVMSLKTVVPVVTVLGILSSAAILRTAMPHVNWPAIWRIMPWCAAGLAIGLYYFSVLDARTLARGLGVVTFVYGAWALWATYRATAGITLPRGWITPVMGTVSGTVGTLFGAMAGMFLAMYLDLLKFGKHEFRATIAAALLVMGVLRAAGYASVGVFDRDGLVACAVAVPLMLIGVWAGNRIHANLDERMFKRLIALIMLLSAVPLMLR